MERAARDVSHTHVHVVEKMDKEHLSRIKQLEQDISKNDQKLILIHNFKSAKTKNEVLKQAFEDIQKHFPNAGQTVDSEYYCVHYLTKNSVHYIYAEEGTEAGKFYNEKTSNCLRDELGKLSRKQFNKRDFVTKNTHFYGRLIKSLESNIKKLIINKPKGYFERIKGYFGYGKKEEKVLDVKLELLDTDKEKGIPSRFFFKDGKDWAITKD